MTKMIDTFLSYLSNHMVADFPWIIVMLMVIGMFAFLGYVIFQIIKNEKDKRKFIPIMKVGDKVHFSFTERI
jgi:F0F1-type ATP synthase assembly protein I